MQLEKLLYKEIVFGGYGRPLISICNLSGLNPRDFAVNILKKYSTKNMSKDHYEKIINKKLRKKVKIKYDCDTKRITFKLLGQKVHYTFIDRTPKDKTEQSNNGSILRKLKQRVKNSHKENQVWVALHYLEDLVKNGAIKKGS